MMIGIERLISLVNERHFGNAVLLVSIGNCGRQYQKASSQRQREDATCGGSKLISMSCSLMMSLILLLTLMPDLQAAAQASSSHVTAQGPARETAMAFEQQGNFTDAEAAWHAWLKTHPGSGEAFAHLGLLEARQERYKEAVPFYRKALALSPAMPSLRLNLGLALFKAGELKQAIQEFQPLLAKGSAGSPEAQRLTILLGMAHYGLADYVPASHYLRDAAARDPQNLELRLALAHSCLWSKQYECVLDAYHEMLTLNAESAEVDMLAAEAEDEMKDFDAAIEQFRAAIKANPNEPEVHFGLGYILWTQRRYAESVTEFQAELVNNPGHAQAFEYLGDADMQLNRPELVSPLLKKAIGITPGLELAHLDLGILAANAGRNDEALREFIQAVKLAPEDVNAHWHLAGLYRAMGKKGEAKAEFEKTRNLHKATNDALLERMNANHSQPAQSPERGALGSQR
jgi:tetratricopeptide (TPR) repeat protein